MLHGECFCGKVRYQIDGKLINARCCHCSRCRKVFSGAGSAFAELDKQEQFQWVAGEDTLTHYATHEEWGLVFCGQCGSTLGGTHKGQVMGVTLGSVNGDPGVEITQHIFVGSKAPWDHIGGDAPQFKEHAES